MDYRDVAEAAAIALTGDTLSYGTFKLSARGMLDQIEVAKMMSEALVRKSKRLRRPSTHGRTSHISPPPSVRE